jgi:hypothetical protein
MSGIPATQRDPEIRFFTKIDATGPCWEWTGALSFGYGRFRDGKLVVQAHRWAWKRLVGEIDDDLDLDHLCRNRKCCNPDHLEPVSRQENLRRGAQGGKTRCVRGHAFSGENLYVNKGKRYCVTCLRIRKNAR